jgi:hypothetical protein
MQANCKQSGKRSSKQACKQRHKLLTQRSGRFRRPRLLQISEACDASGLRAETGQTTADGVTGVTHRLQRVTGACQLAPVVAGDRDRQHPASSIRQ